ncbi:hypothetical protein BVC80_3295g1 [Macleaya cordata]|uniref:Uncharacterized protein n=1 Tax=Macleaya cordata TaxID=56857 RepID=A0A200QJC8_MACCD|nr:hypothetical protein BVC80_3295g1 [Macleaya cordata]
MLISEVGVWQDNRLAWKIEFSRRIIEEEIDDMAIILGALDIYEFDREGVDEITWLREKNKEFSVRSCYKFFEEEGEMDLFSMWDTQRLNLQGKEIWELILAAVVWCLWVERNRRAFEDKEKSREKLIIEIKALIFYWASTMRSFQDVSFQNVIVNWRRTYFDPP